MTRAFEESTDAADFARRCARSPDLLAEVRDRGPMIARLAAPLDVGDVFQILQPIMLIYDPPEFSDDDAGHAATKAWKGEWAKALRNTPREALKEAVAAWIARGDMDNPRRRGSFPKPADLLKLAESKAAKIHSAAWRVRKALEAAPAAQRQEPSAEEKAEVKRLAAEFKARPAPADAPPAVTRQQMAERLRQAADRA
jgi:hypothetical protein